MEYFAFVPKCLLRMVDCIRGSTRRYVNADLRQRRLNVVLRAPPSSYISDQAFIEQLLGHCFSDIPCLTYICCYCSSFAHIFFFYRSHSFEPLKPAFFANHLYMVTSKKRNAITLTIRYWKSNQAHSTPKQAELNMKEREE